MSRSFTSSKFENRLRETMSNQLQRELENITQSFEHEKREACYLDEQIKLIQLEIKEIPKAKVPDIGLKAAISVLEKKLELETKILDQQKHKNKGLRKQIDEYRLDKHASKISMTKILGDLDRISKITDEQYVEVKKTGEQDTIEQERIKMIRAKSANHRFKYDEKISTLNSMLKDSQFESRTLYSEGKYSTQNIEIIAVLKKIVGYSKKLTVEKKREIDHYLRFITNIVAGFENIKLATGINTINDIVTTCVKSEEQGQQVLSYLHELNCEIDNLEDKLQLSNSKIKLLEGSRNQGRLSYQEVVKANDLNFKSIRQKIADNKSKEEHIEYLLMKVLPMMKKLYGLIEMVNFSPFFSEKIDAQAVEKLNQENCVVLIGHLEEFIYFLTMAKQLKDSKRLVLQRKEDEAGQQGEKKKKLLHKLMEEKDLYEDPEFDEIRLPISLNDMKNRALFILEQRRSLLKKKNSTPDASQIKRINFNNPEDW